MTVFYCLSYMFIVEILRKLSGNVKNMENFQGVDRWLISLEI